MINIVFLGLNLESIVSDTLDKFGLKEKASGFIKALISENLLLRGR